jgi:hypothetical protein
VGSAAETTALRALAHGWHRWCRVDFVLDPDQLFDDVAYLMGVLLDQDDGGGDDLDGEVEDDLDDDLVRQLAGNDKGDGADNGNDNGDGAAGGACWCSRTATS